MPRRAETCKALGVAEEQMCRGCTERRPCCYKAYIKRHQMEDESWTWSSDPTWPGKSPRARTVTPIGASPVRGADQRDSSTTGGGSPARVSFAVGSPPSGVRLTRGRAKRDRAKAWRDALTDSIKKDMDILISPQKSNVRVAFGTEAIKKMATGPLDYFEVTMPIEDGTKTDSDDERETKRVKLRFAQPRSDSSPHPPARKRGRPRKRKKMSGRPEDNSGVDLLGEFEEANRKRPRHEPRSVADAMSLGQVAQVSTAPDGRTGDDVASCAPAPAGQDQSMFWDARQGHQTHQKNARILEKKMFSLGHGSIVDTAMTFQILKSRVATRQLPVLDSYDYMDFVGGNNDDGEGATLVPEILTAENREVAAASFEALRRNLSRYRENNKKGGNYTKSEDQQIDTVFRMLTPDPPLSHGYVSKFARAVAWDTGAGRHRILMAASRRTDSRECRIVRKKRKRYSNQRDYQCFDDWVHENTRENNGASKKVRTFWLSHDDAGNPIRKFRECWPHTRFESKEKLAAKFLESAEYIEHLKEGGQELSQRQLEAHICNCVKPNKSTECACPIHTQADELLKALRQAFSTVYGPQDNERKRMGSAPTDEGQPAIALCTCGKCEPSTPFRKCVLDMAALRDYMLCEPEAHPELSLEGEDVFFSQEGLLWPWQAR